MQLMINPTPCPGDALVIQQRAEIPLNHLWVIESGPRSSAFAGCPVSGCLSNGLRLSGYEGDERAGICAMPPGTVVTFRPPTFRSSSQYRREGVGALRAGAQRRGAARRGRVMDREPVEGGAAARGVAREGVGGGAGGRILPPVEGGVQGLRQASDRIKER